MMLLLKRYAPKLPGVLIAVAITTLVSWSTGFESKMSADVNRIADPEVRAEAQAYMAGEAEIKTLEMLLLQQRAALKQARANPAVNGVNVATMDFRLDLTELELADRTKKNRKRFQALRRHLFVSGAEESAMFALHNQVTSAVGVAPWSIKKIDATGVYLVVGNSINSIDASGEDKIREINLYLRDAGVTLTFCGLKKPLRDTFDRSGLTAELGEENVFNSTDLTFQTLETRLSAS